MNKRKIFTLAMAVMMIAILAVGGSLAYFMDTDEATNVFTVGAIDITLDEVFDPDNAELLPGMNVTKEIRVTNHSETNDSYIRLHIAFPAILDSGSEDEPEFAAYNNTLHWNFTNASLADGQWNWNVAADGDNYPGNGGAWNMYQQEVDGVLYNVYVATYETALAPEEQTANEAIYKVYLDTKVTQEDMAAIIEELGEIKVLVIAEGTQATNDQSANWDAYTALNTAFGVPGSYNPWAAE